MRRIWIACLALLLLPVAGHADDALDIVIYGATGKVGRHVVQEALDRNHRVTAVSRDPTTVTLRHENLTVAKGDLLDKTSIAELVANKDVVIVSVRGVIGDSGTPESALQYIAAENLVDVLYKDPKNAARLIHIGGSGSLEVGPGVPFAATLPTFILPKKLANGPRTGVFRIGGDAALEDSRGRTRLSRADFAVALIDEAEQAKYARQRISVAY
jgi:putative NADH-flavin reductase